MELDLPGKVVFIGNDFRTYELALGFAKKRMSHRIESEQFFCKVDRHSKVGAEHRIGNGHLYRSFEKERQRNGKKYNGLLCWKGKHLGVQQISNAKITAVMEKGVHYIQEDAEHFLPCRRRILIYRMDAKSFVCTGAIPP